MESSPLFSGNMLMKLLAVLGLSVIQGSASFLGTNQGPVACSAISIAVPKLLGAQVLDLTASEVYRHDKLGEGGTAALDFCNVTVTYTHPGQNDTIHTQVWLPLHGWNGRFQGTGGGGWNAGMGGIMMNPAIADGYAAAFTDGGHPINRVGTLAPSAWAQLSPGNVNMYAFQDFASVALNDMTVFGKAITEAFYGRPPRYSYWNGCSTGGRQGLMMAQRYPKAYDGILANAPAINWATLMVSNAWPQQLMNQMGAFPSRCELAAYSDEAIKACDALDGLVDGIIGAPELCDFDPHSLVGKSFKRNGHEEMKFTLEGAEVAYASWNGPHSSSRNLGWYGFNKDAPLSTLYGPSHSRDGTEPTKPFAISDQWIRYFVVKDPDFNTANMTEAEYFSVLHASRNQYDSIISANDPDLTDFRNAGGKMITWHGLADQILTPKGTEDYYRRVLDLDPGAQDFYRYFEAPGVAHCAGGPGPYPSDAFAKLVQWVEEGTMPDTLSAHGNDGSSRDLCLYPLVQRYAGGDPKAATSFQCVTRSQRGQDIGSEFVVQG